MKDHRLPGAPVRTGFCLLVLSILLIITTGTGDAAPVPESLRADRVGSVVHLTWELDRGPFGVYRSNDASDVLRPAWLIDVVPQTWYDDPIRSDDPPLIFYLVDDPLPCFTAADCDDHDACDGIEVCDGAQQCFPGIPVLCGDNNACTLEACDPETGDCDSQPLDCNDGDPCTVDSCDPVAGCLHRVDPLGGIGTPEELAGVTLDKYPFFEFADAFNEGGEIRFAVDPSARPDLVGETCDLYLVEDRSAASWCTGAVLEDFRGTPDTVSIVSGGIEDNIFILTDGHLLSGDAGTSIGAGFDLALDCNRNGLLDAGEPADGLQDGAGLWIVHDLTIPGPLAVSGFDDIGPDPPHCSGGGNDDMRIYYPSLLDDPEYTGRFPLVVISHGNGHCYDWYDFLGDHLASYGYIVMSHDNDTVPGIETASETTLVFTGRIVTEQAALGGGVLAGHIDSHRIAWIGHSRGGEGVVRAYDRLVDEAYPSSGYSADDIVVVSSIAPTDFLGPTESDPHGVPYHLLYGSADGDVCGCPGQPISYSFSLYERAVGPRQSTYVHGADHNDFNCCGFNDFDGPPETQIGRPEAQQVQKAATLALLKIYLEQQTSPREYFHRQYEALRPLGVDPATVVVHESREHPAKRSFVIDDFQTETSTAVSSSGGTVSSDVTDLVEDLQREGNSSYEWLGTEPMNGMSRARVEDTTRGAVFEYGGGDRYLEFDVVPGREDFTDDSWLSFRAGQGTRHPETAAALEDLAFTVTLIDGGGSRSSINIASYGGGIEEPYQRSGYGAGDGWQNEYETIRIRLADFLRNGSGLDLADIRKVRFEFGPSFGSAVGRLGIDDIELTKE